MGTHIYYRILGYVVTIALHVGNLKSLEMPVSKDVMNDYRLKHFVQLKYRYLTAWTFILQTVFAVSGLACDLLTLCNSGKKDFRLPKYLKGFRDTLFCGIVYPSVILVFTFFWGVYLYDRNLVYPEFLDKFLTPINNHIMHTAILPLALWEVFFQPRKKPSRRAHGNYIVHGLIYCFAYLTVVLFTYAQKGIWVYPLLKEINGTIYFPLLVVGLITYALLLYTSHWILVSVLWRNLEQPKKKIR